MLHVVVYFRLIKRLVLKKQLLKFGKYRNTLVIGFFLVLLLNGFFFIQSVKKILIKISTYKKLYLLTNRKKFDLNTCLTN